MDELSKQCFGIEGIIIPRGSDKIEPINENEYKRTFQMPLIKAKSSMHIEEEVVDCEISVQHLESSFKVYQNQQHIVRNI